MECLVMLKGVPESGRSDELASDTGTPRCVASRVSAQPLTAIASVRTDARVTSTRFTALLEIGGGGAARVGPHARVANVLCIRGCTPHRTAPPRRASRPAP